MGRDFDEHPFSRENSIGKRVDRFVLNVQSVPRPDGEQEVHRMRILALNLARTRIWKVSWQVNKRNLRAALTDMQLSISVSRILSLRQFGEGTIFLKRILLPIG
jgi:hypothetical protein